MNLSPLLTKSYIGGKQKVNPLLLNRKVQPARNVKRLTERKGNEMPKIKWTTLHKFQSVASWAWPVTILVLAIVTPLLVRQSVKAYRERQD